MTKQEKVILQNYANRINQLASLERACFTANKEKDKEVKNTIKPYMTWFEIVAMDIQELIDLQDEKDSYHKKYKMEELERNSYFL